MKAIQLLAILIFSLPMVAFSQQDRPAENAEEFENTKKWRVKREYLNGVYIPKDLTDAFVQLNKLIEDESKAKFKLMDEDDAAKKLHFSFGKWITVNWGFYEGSRLSAFLNGIGLFHPDDMATFVMTTYHRNLNREKLNVKDLVAKLRVARQMENQKKLDTGEILYSSKRKKYNKD